ncbi:MAG: hypothetical protein ACI845_000449 [Gammaproteobacteria bacterium]|jgi:uncharacterized protein (DUF849 family)
MRRLEGSLFIGKHELATSNAQQVKLIRTIVENPGREITTLAQARERLNLKGANKINFLNTSVDPVKNESR